VADLPPKSAARRLVARQWWRRDADFLRQNEGDQTDVTVVLEEHLEWIERLSLMHVDKYCPSPACPLAATL